ncbi:hypothetical protein JCM10213_003394 [Rhodosporidiobolus nylandii]
MPDPSRLTALITGAASGIALALGRSLLAHSFPSYNLLLVDLSPSRLSAVAAELAAEFGAERVDYVAADVTHYEALAGAFKKARGREGWSGRVDVVGAVAGISEVFSTPDGRDPFLASAVLPADGMAPEKPPSMKVVDVNLQGLLTHAHFRSQPPLPTSLSPSGLKGRLICAGSAASLYAFPNEPLYGAAKHGVLGAVRSLAPELMGEGITINAFAPSIVDTGIGNPTAIAAIRSAGCLTPMETVTRGIVDVLLSWEREGEALTGQIVELVLSHLLIRLPPREANEDAGRCLKMMWPCGREAVEASVGRTREEEMVEWLRGKGVEVARE